jgi:hypothetical protein
LSEYDQVSFFFSSTNFWPFQVLYEDSSVNRLRDTIQLYKTTVNSEYFNTKPIVLFFNKADVLREKMNVSKFENWTAAFDGPAFRAPDTDDDEVLFEAIVDYHRDLFQANMENFKRLFVHTVTAVDYQVVSKIWTSTKDWILTQALEQSGLI